MYSVDERRELLGNIKDGAIRMDRVVANLLDTARLESGMMQLKTDWCDMEDIVGSALRRLSEQIAGRPLDVWIQEGLPLLRGDCVLLEQVIINLVDNALKYSPLGSLIEIRVRPVEEGLKVSVSDRGVGISAEDLPHIFDKFYRAHQRLRNIPGTGLGLSICKGIVEVHGGAIQAENRDGGGAIFSFVLPLKSSGDKAVQPEGEDTDER
jgi:two-component system sensor histidine kinase KdpD